MDDAPGVAGRGDGVSRPELRASGSLWLCIWERPYRREVVSGPEPSRVPSGKGRPGPRELVVRECERLGLGTPDHVICQGYGASPSPSKTVARKKRERTWAAGRVRTVEALHLYAALRVDWPIPSRQAPEERRRASARVLLDFVANMGVAIASLDGDGARARLVSSVVEAQSEGWMQAALEHNAEHAAEVYRRAEERSAALGGKDDLVLELRALRVEHEEMAAAAHRRGELARHRAKRLKDQKAWREAIGELDEIIAGEVDGWDEVREEFARFLVSAGWPENDASMMAAAWSRISVPRL